MQYLKEIAGLKSLKTLLLNNTKLTDMGLKELVGLKSLQTLNLVAQNDGHWVEELAGLNCLQT